MCCNRDGLLSADERAQPRVELRTQQLPIRSVRRTRDTLQAAIFQALPPVLIVRTRAVNVVRKWLSLLTVKELLRHATLAMTLRHAHLASSHLHEAVETLGVAPSVAMLPQTTQNTARTINWTTRYVAEIKTGDLVPEEGVEPTRGVIPGRF